MNAPRYLNPYLDAASRHGGGFASLLWASPRTQATRFDALIDLCPMHDRIIVDAGCGRADLLDHLLKRKIRPSRYVGIEAVAPLADAAKLKHHAACSIVRDDFVKNPAVFDVSPDVIVFSGSLNTLDDDTFHASISHAFSACRQSVVFNFLSSARLASATHLYWRAGAAVLEFVRTLSVDLGWMDDYMEGDMTIAIKKQS